MGSPLAATSLMTRLDVHRSRAGIKAQFQRAGCQPASLVYAGGYGWVSEHAREATGYDCAGTGPGSRQLQLALGEGRETVGRGRPGRYRPDPTGDGVFANDQGGSGRQQVQGDNQRHPGEASIVIHLQSN